MAQTVKIGQYLTLEEFCTCTRTYQKYADQIDPYPENRSETKPLLLKVCRPIKEVWNEVNQDMDVEAAEVQVGLSFEAEGNIYIAKSKAGANLTVKLVLKPKV